MIRSQTQADVNAAQAAVAGKSWRKIASAPLKGQRYPFYYGIHPTGRYPDQPFIRELYYDGAATDLLLSGAKPVPIPPPVIPAAPARNWNWDRQLLAVRRLAPTGNSRVGPQTAACATPAIAKAKHDKVLC